MAQRRYEVIYSGTLREGLAPDAVRERLKLELRLEQSQLDALFTGGKIPLKLFETRNEADRYVATLRQIGLQCWLHLVEGEQGAARVLDVSAAPVFAARQSTRRPQWRGAAIGAVIVLLGGAFIWLIHKPARAPPTASAAETAAAAPTAAGSVLGVEEIELHVLQRKWLCDGGTGGAQALNFGDGGAWFSYSLIHDHIYRETGAYHAVNDRIVADVDSAFGGARVFRVTSAGDDAFAAAVAGGRLLSCRLDANGYDQLAGRYQRQERTEAATGGQPPPASAPAPIAAAQPAGAAATEPVPAARVETVETAPTPAAGETASFMPADTPPSYDRQRVRQPDYPREAALKEEQGDVLVRVLVGMDGHVRSQRVEHSSGSRALDRAALGAVQGWDFKPGTHNGQPVDGVATVTVSFRLAN